MISNYLKDCNETCLFLKFIFYICSSVLLFMIYVFHAFHMAVDIALLWGYLLFKFPVVTLMNFMWLFASPNFEASPYLRRYFVHFHFFEFFLLGNLLTPASINLHKPYRSHYFMGFSEFNFTHTAFWKTDGFESLDWQANTKGVWL